MITTQLPFDYRIEFVPDPDLAEALVGRFAGPGLVITLTGESYRSRKAGLALTTKSV